eukprot:6983865-Karenia_brevis.AAC.1
MKADVLMKLMKSGRLSLRPTPEIQLLKLRKQKLRASRKSESATENAAHAGLALDLDFKISVGQVLPLEH